MLNDRGLPALRGSLQCGEGEILGIAGVDGNGQTELAEAITGLRATVAGEILLNGQSVTNRPPGSLIEEGVAHIPADRRAWALFLTLIS
jgi:simple sugar transport system ATP-binding protein